MTSTSTHDSQVVIPLAYTSHDRVVSLYDLMDAVYDAPQIHQVSRDLGHRPLIDSNPRRNKALTQELTAENKRRRCIDHQPADVLRYNERSTVERVNARLKGEFGGRMVRRWWTCQSHVSFDVWHSGADRDSIDGWSDVS